ncbi:GAF domain-containing protein [Halorubrum ezzemoulense]|uniref:GAF domain-containing protein n=1 Tax=Halorubrum ezzemoulense TaxID=337243 RepID=UPI00232DEC48|nr:GAF domain-containing protein [Halorubrum ezzemoulense]MDB2238119.1 GAF domain-containing protein [Halorubrum ezzemoulense]MDB2247588.1 GAF domain-containing protein [Halorubrum ezzemoulense]
MTMDHFPEAINATPDPTLVVDGDGVVHAGTPSVETVFGLDPDDLSGRAIGDVFEDPTELDWGRVASPPSVVDRDDGEAGAAGDAEGVAPGGAEGSAPGDGEESAPLGGEEARAERDGSRHDVTALIETTRAGEARSMADGFELAVRRGDGVLVPVRVSVGPFELGGDPYAVVTAIDVTNERTRRLALQRRTKTLESLHEATRELLKTTDRETAAEAAVSYVDDVLGHPIAAIWLYDERENALEPIVWTDTADDVVGEHPTFAADEPSITWEVFESGEPTYVADVHDDPDRHSDDATIRSELVVPLGRYGVLNVGATAPEAFDDSDLAVARIWAATVTMVLVRIERERQLRRREAEIARERDRLEEFASLVSHDLRSPLNVATGNLEIVTERLAEESVDVEELGAVERSLDRMDVLIEDLLALARQGASIDETEPVALPDLVAECWETVDTESATIAVETDAVVAADRSRLRQALENLIANAVAHAGPDVAVTVGALDDGFYLEDDGPGVDPEDRGEVFEAGVTTDHDGTGFGLKIVAEVAEAHGWAVELAESEAGGARFEFRGVDLDPGDG